MIPVPVNAAELMDFSNALNKLDELRLQVEGTVHVEGVGYMKVEYDGVNDVNVIRALEVDE